MIEAAQVNQDRALEKFEHIIFSYGVGPVGGLMPLMSRDLHKTLVVEIDNVEDNLSRVKSNSGESAHAFIRRTAGRDPLSSMQSFFGKVDTILAFNFVDDPPQKRSNQDSFDVILSEWEALLSDGGVVLIGSWYSPEWASWILERDFSDKYVVEKIFTFEGDGGVESELVQVGMSLGGVYTVKAGWDSLAKLSKESGGRSAVVSNSTASIPPKLMYIPNAPFLLKLTRR